MSTQVGERTILTPEEAEAMLPDGERIHTFRNPAGMLLGADWDRADVLNLFSRHSPELAGPAASSAGHGIVVIDESGPVFIETKKENANGN